MKPRSSSNKTLRITSLTCVSPTSWKFPGWNKTSPPNHQFLFGFHLHFRKQVWCTLQPFQKTTMQISTCTCHGSSTSRGKRKQGEQTAKGHASKAALRLKTARRRFFCPNWAKRNLGHQKRCKNFNLADSNWKVTGVITPTTLFIWPTNKNQNLGQTHFCTQKYDDSIRHEYTTGIQLQPPPRLELMHPHHA